MQPNTSPQSPDSDTLPGAGIPPGPYASSDAIPQFPRRETTGSVEAVGDGAYAAAALAAQEASMSYRASQETTMHGVSNQTVGVSRD